MRKFSTPQSGGKVHAWKCISDFDSIVSDFLQHLSENFHRKSHDIGLTSFDEVDPVEPILIAERPRFSFPAVGVEIGLELLVGDRIHDELAAVDPNLGANAGAFPEAQSAVNVVLAAAHHAEHLPGVIAVARLTEDHAATFRDGVAADHDSVVDLYCHVGCFLHRQSSDEFRRCFAAADATLGRVGRSKHRKVIASFT